MRPSIKQIGFAWLINASESDEVLNHIFASCLDFSEQDIRDSYATNGFSKKWELEFMPINEHLHSKNEVRSYFNCELLIGDILPIATWFDENEVDWNVFYGKILSIKEV